MNPVSAITANSNAMFAALQSAQTQQADIAEEMIELSIAQKSNATAQAILGKTVDLFV